MTSPDPLPSTEEVRALLEAVEAVGTESDAEGELVRVLKLLAAQREKVLELHHPGVKMPSVSTPDQQCMECSDEDASGPVPWPCATVQALSAALTDTKEES